jgi:uncharacterized protein DUF4124
VKTMIALAATLIATAAHGQLLKCVGKDGRVEYAAQCPAGTREQSTGIKNTPAPAPAPAGAAVPKAGSVAPKEQSLAERDADFRKRQKEKQEADAKEARASAETAQRQRACEDARAYLKNLQSGNRAVKVDPKTGERVFLEDAQYASEIAAAQKIADANCK